MSMPTHASFAEQALHYFDRPHEAVCREPIVAPSAWRGKDMRRSRDWLVTLDGAEVAELEAAAARVRDRGLPMQAIGRDDVPLPRLAPRLAAWRRELDGGRGFLLVRGLPVARWGDELSAVAYWGLGLHLGRPGAQNPRGDLLGHVIDTGEDVADPFVRRYRTAGDIAYHCDLADVVGLLCLRAARRGGASRIVSSVTVYNELLARRPELVARLYEPFRLDSRGEQGSRGSAWVPVSPCRFAAGRLRTFYHSDYFRSVVRHPDVPPFTDDERALLDLYEEVAEDPTLRLDMRFEPGDVQLISNHTVLHARTAYEDEPGITQKRHLLRLWLSFT
jgi:hypothetical protein